MNFGLGVDTGGTYTDASIINISDGTVMDSNKSLTTYPDLITGIKNSIVGLNATYLKDVKFVSVSTTLATNTTLEGKGYPAGLILIGYSIPKNLSTEYVISIRGGHDTDGNEIESLGGLESVEDFVIQNKNKVAAFAVSSYFGVRNPEHEIKVKEVIQSLTGLPVVCGHELSMDLGAYERAVTALLNAQLIPVTNQFIRSILSVMEEMEIDADLMMMKCDGSLVGIEEALEKPVETIFSGPAASLVGAAHLARLKTCVMMDVGGTSTDVSMISNGIPEISESGAVVGGWNTMVKAIKMDTSALGGDSHVWVQRSVSMGPNRVIPLCLAAFEHPDMIDKLAEMDKPNVRIMDDIVQPTTFFVRSGLNYCDLDSGKISDHEKEILDTLDEPLSISDISEKTNSHPLIFSTVLQSLIQKRYINQIGFTPTDALHVLGEYTKWNPEASRMGAELLGSYVDMDKGGFCSYVKENVAKNLSLSLVSFFIDDVKRSDIKKIMERSDLTAFKIKVPVVLIGAPVKAYLNELNNLVDAEIIVPDYHEVGNAVGALMGNVIHRAEVLVRPFAPGSGQYVVFSEVGRELFDGYEAALDHAVYLVENLVLEYMKKYGLGMEKIQFDLKRHDVKSTGGLPLETRLVGVGIGTPRRVL